VTLLWQDAVEQYLDSLYDPKKPEEATNRPATRKDYKSKLAVPELRTFRGRAISTITREEIAAAEKDPAAILALIYQTVMTGIGSLVLAFGIMGIILVLLRPEVRPATPLLWILGATATYKLLQNALLFYQINYLNGVFPLFIPFVAVSMTFIRNTLHRPEGPKLAAPP